jgi:alanine racemase
MNPQMRTWAEISLDNLEHNYNAIRSSLPEGGDVIGIVKANAYGHGAVPVARRLSEIGCKYLAVACISEAQELRSAGIDTPILILGPEPPASAPLAAELNVSMAVGSFEAAREISALLPPGASVKIHVKLDTGMCRTGFWAFSRDELLETVKLFALPGIEPEGIFTHFAVSDVLGDPFTKLQFDCFRSFVDVCETAAGRRFKIKHCANSAAVINYREKMSLDYVRPGISLYGAYPGDDRGGIDLRPVMTLKTRVAAVNSRHAGDTVSYGRTHTLSKDTRIAVLPVGYGDGLPRILSNNMSVRFGGETAPQLGRICMDMCMVDITLLPHINTGDTAVIFGGGGSSAEALAKAAGTISYELFCGINDRVPRIFI